VTALLAIIAVQASLGALLFGTLILERSSGPASPGEGQPHDLRLLRRRSR
jgi:hypothetical protein